MPSSPRGYRLDEDLCLEDEELKQVDELEELMTSRGGTEAEDDLQSEIEGTAAAKEQVETPSALDTEDEDAESTLEESTILDEEDWEDADAEEGEEGEEI